MLLQSMNIVQENFSLKNHNTFGLNIKTNLFFIFNSIDSLLEILGNKIYNSCPLLVLGSGSNILFTRNFEGLVIHPVFKGFEVVDEDDDFVFIKVFCGEIWDDFVEFAVSNDYGGVENLSGIPGCIGACPIQNIGAYGTEVKDTITQVETIDLKTKKISFFSNNDCQFSYRNSIFKNEKKGQYLIFSVTFKLNKKPVFNTCYGDIEKEIQLIGDVNLRNIRQAVVNIRNKKLPDPVVLGNAGSFFKNPVVPQETVDTIKKLYPDVPLFSVSLNTYKIPAGWLIEKCGWKGKRADNVGVHDKQALVLVNYGNGNGLEILNLAQDIISSVHEKFNIVITPEVNII